MTFRSARRLLTVAVLALMTARCGEPETSAGTTFLLDGAHQPDILTESRRIDPPPSTAGNRFLKGWWPIREVPGAGLYPEAANTRLEIVNLGSAGRALVLSITLKERRDEGEVVVEAQAAGQPLGSFRVAGGRLEVPLPDSLPLGRVAVDLAWEGPQVVVEQAGLTPARPAGDVVLEGRNLLQAGDSLVDMVRPSAQDAFLEGNFEPPGDAGPDQRFRLLLEDEAGTQRTGFEWRASRWRPFSRVRSFRIPLEPGWSRIRLLAEGEGPPGRWRDLRIAGPSADPTPVPAVASPPEQPRIVLVYVMDALRDDFLGHLGGPEGISPTVDRLASEGTTFTRHLSVAPNTMPSTKSLFTGLMFLTQGSGVLPRKGSTTLAQTFRAAGYKTGLFTGNGNVSRDFGLDRGFDVAPRRLLFKAYADTPGMTYNDNAERVHEATLGWLDHLGSDEKVFLFLQPIHPHNPYDPPEPFLGNFVQPSESTIDGSTETLFDVRQQRLRLTQPDRDRIRDLYAASVAYNDAELRSFLDDVLSRYPEGEVLVILTSDHGEELFEHRGILHGYTLYDEQLRIPLVVWWPGRVPVQRLDIATDNVDLHATLNALVGGEPVPEGGGRSLWGPLTGTGQPGKEHHFAAASSVAGGIFAARTDRWKVIFAPQEGIAWGMGQGLGRSRDVEYVFDLESDPDEQENLAGHAGLEAAWLRSRLLAWIEVGKRLELGTPVEELDEDTVESLKALGYLQ